MNQRSPLAVFFCKSLLTLFICISLVLSLVPTMGTVLPARLAPTLAFAESAQGAECTESAAANSWRYADGQLMDADEICTDNSTEVTTGTSSLFTLATTVASWKASNGTSSYTLGSKKVAISGVQRVGIDVSKWQGSINWEKVAAAGIDFAIIRCGYGSNKTAYDDAYFLSNVAGAQAAGIEIGVYLYSYATTVSAARSEAKHALRLLSAAGLDPNALDLPVFLDMEDSTQAALSAKKLGKIASAFCSAIELQGYVPGIYANTSWWSDHLTASVFETEGWYRWVARYSTSTSTKSTGIDSTAIWQFTSTGTVSGISGSVDVNFDFNGEGTYSTLNAASTGYDRIKLTWTKVADASSYEIQRKVSGGSYKTVKTTTATSYTDKGLSCGTKYFYRIRAVYEAEDGAVTYGTWWRRLSARPKPARASISSLKRGPACTTLSLTWGSVSGATGYEVSRKKAGGSWKKVRSVAASTAGTGGRFSWKNTGLTLGKSYSYRVRAYAKVSGTKYYGPWSSVKVRSCAPVKTELHSIYSASKRSGTLEWDDVSGAGGYQVAYRRKGSSRWYYATAKTTKKTLRNLVGKKYYVKVRAYKRSNGKTCYGAWSAQELLEVI